MIPADVSRVMPLLEVRMGAIQASGQFIRSANVQTAAQSAARRLSTYNADEINAAFDEWERRQNGTPTRLPSGDELANIVLSHRRDAMRRSGAPRRDRKGNATPEFMRAWSAAMKSAGLTGGFQAATPDSAWGHVLRHEHPAKPGGGVNTSRCPRCAVDLARSTDALAVLSRELPEPRRSEWACESCIGGFYEGASGVVPCSKCMPSTFNNWASGSYRPD